MNSMNSFHQRSHSHSTHTQTNRQMLKHQRSISSIQGLSFNGNPSAMKFYSPHGLPSTPFTSYGFDNTDDMLCPSRHPLHHFDDSSSVNGNDDPLTKFRDLDNSGRFGFNNSRFVSNGGKISLYYLQGKFQRKNVWTNNKFFAIFIFR